MEEVQHFSHDCPSTLLETTLDGVCSLCRKETSIRFTCNTCTFDLCDSCFKLTPKILHTLHPQHHVEFSPGQPGQQPSSFICCGCGYISSGPYYECKDCEIKIDPKCASGEIRNGWDNKTVFHYSHRHVLSRCRPGFIGTCLMCEHDFSDTTVCYGCVHCLCFIHECCIDLPREIRHPVHPHPLIRLDYTQHRELKILCEACKEDISGVPFGCVECGFNLHIGCADSLLRSLKHESHPHRLSYVAKSFEFTVYGCRICKQSKKIISDSYYHCVECNSNFHYECLRIPGLLVSKSLHLHPLWCKRLDHSWEFNCDVCEATMHRGHPAYYCKECDFRAHIACILRKKEPLPMYLKSLYSRDDENDVSVKKGVHGATSEGNGENKLLMVKDRLHTHLLGSFDDYGPDVKRCDMCYRPIDGAELGQRSTHEFHRSHPLTLLPEPPIEEITCDHCGFECWGFNLFCRTCDFVIDFRCAARDGRLVQRVASGTRRCMRGHKVQPRLHLRRLCKICGEYADEKALLSCSDPGQEIGQQERYWSCSECGEDYHDQCLELARGPVRYPFHPHLLHLQLPRGVVRHPRKLQDNIRICGRCRNEIHYGDYRYQCGDCSSCFHVKCPKREVAERLLKVMCHDHKLRRQEAYVEDTHEASLVCNVCGRPSGNTSFYGCDECDFIISHEECVFPAYLKHYRHRHILTFKRSLSGIGTASESKCCRSACDPIGPAYVCELCEDHVFHVECVMPVVRTRFLLVKKKEIRSSFSRGKPSSLSFFSSSSFSRMIQQFEQKRITSVRKRRLRSEERCRSLCSEARFGCSSHHAFFFVFDSKIKIS